jgi:N-acetylneuraminate lyase
MKMNKQIKGVMPALVTPLNSDGITVNVSALRKLIGYHKSLGADGFYIAGATGEGLVLSMDARKTLIDQAISEIGDDQLKIVHVADMNFENTKYLAKYAESAGADVISAIPPIYFGYDQEDIYNYYKEIAAQVKIPLMLYYTPAANTTLDTKLFLRLLEFDNITSVKWTMKDYYKLIELITASENRMTVINGPDEMLLCGLSAGCAGGIGTTYNVMLPLYKKIYELYQAGDMKGALEVQKKADKVVGVLIKYQGIQATKVVLEAMGFEVGNATFPMKAYTPEQKKQIFEEVLAAGFTY